MSIRILKQIVQLDDLHVQGVATAASDIDQRSRQPLKQAIQYGLSIFVAEAQCLEAFLAAKILLQLVKCDVVVEERLFESI